MKAFNLGGKKDPPQDENASQSGTQPSVQQPSGGPTMTPADRARSFLGGRKDKPPRPEKPPKPEKQPALKPEKLPKAPKTEKPVKEPKTAADGNKRRLVLLVVLLLVVAGAAASFILPNYLKEKAPQLDANGVNSTTKQPVHKNGAPGKQAGRPPADTADDARGNPDAEQKKTNKPKGALENAPVAGEQKKANGRPGRGDAEEDSEDTPAAPPPTAKPVVKPAATPVAARTAPAPQAKPAPQPAKPVVAAAQKKPASTPAATPAPAKKTPSAKASKQAAPVAFRQKPAAAPVAKKSARPARKKITTARRAGYTKPARKQVAFADVSEQLPDLDESVLIENVESVKNISPYSPSDDLFSWENGQSAGHSKTYLDDTHVKNKKNMPENSFKTTSSYYMVLLKESVNRKDLLEMENDLEGRTLSPEIKKVVSHGKAIYWLVCGHYTSQQKAFNKSLELRNYGFKTTIVSEKVKN